MTFTLADLERVVADAMARVFRSMVHAMNRPILITLPDYKVMRYDLSGYGWKPAKRKRASKGWRRHIRRVKAAERRGVKS